MPNLAHRLACGLLLTVATPLLAQPPLAYVIDSDVDQLFVLNSQGLATAIGSFGGLLTDPAGLAWRLDTRTLWTIDFADGQVGTVNTSTGRFTHVFTAVPASGWQGIDYDPSTGMFWLINGDGNLYRLDPATGFTTRIGATGVPLLTALETNAAGTLWSIGFANGVLYRIDKATGAATATVTTSPVNMQGLSFGPDGRLFATNTTTDSLYLINPATGATTLTGAHGAAVRFAKGLEITFTLAAVALSGAGCPTGSSVSFYELFRPTTFDLRNTGIQLTPTGSGYRVATSAGAFVPPVSASLALGDDALSPALTLPFTLPFPGGSTTQIRVCSNGFIHLSGTGTSTDFSPTVTEALASGPRLFPLWMDLNPAAGGSVFYDVGSNSVRVTWLDVPEFGLGNLNTVQVELRASGVIEYRWLVAGNAGTNHDCLVGFSPGAANRDPGNRDLSATMPFTTAADVLSLRQDAGRPVIGQNCQLRVLDIPSGSVAGVELLGLPEPGGGIDLTPLRMPGCSLYVLPIAVTLPFATSAASATITVPIPNNINLSGARLAVQAVVLKPGINAGGAVTSNLATLTLGEL